MKHTKIININFHIFLLAMPFFLIPAGYDLGQLIGIKLSFRIFLLAMLFVPFFLYAFKISKSFLACRFSYAYILIALYFLLYLLLGIYLNLDVEKFIIISILQFIYFVFMLLSVYFFLKYSYIVFDRYIKYTIIVFLFVNLITFGIYLYYNNAFVPGSTGHNGYYLIYDFWGRYQFLSSEPSYAAFILGIMTFMGLIEIEGVVKKYTIAIFFIITLYYTEAKFGLIAFVLSVVLAFFSKHLALVKNNLYMLLSSLIFFVFAPYAFQDIFFEQIEKNYLYEATGTFATRVGLFFSSLKHLMHYPFGSGFGGYLTTASIYLEDFIGTYKMIDTEELRRMISAGYDNKETIGYIVYIFGFPGLIVMIFYSLKLIGSIKNFYLLCLVYFFLISSFTYINSFVLAISYYCLAYIIYKKDIFNEIK